MKLLRTTPLLACALASVLAVGLAGCGTTAQAPQHYYLLEPTPALPGLRIAGPGAASGLLVLPTTADSFYDAQPIAFSAATGTRAYYQLNNWTEPPSRMVGALLVDRLRSGGGFPVVATHTGELRGPLVLETHLEEIFHDAATQPGTARISLSATLRDPSHRSVVGQRTFTSSALVATADAPGAVQAFDIALGPLLDDVVAWAGQTAAKSREP
jgi:cholesterol transport system auxiliary component